MGLAITPTAWADDGSNVVGATIGVDIPEHGSLTFKVTVVAGTETVGEVTLVDAKTYQGDLVLDQVMDEGGFIYAITAVGASAFSESNLTSVEFKSDLTGQFPAIGANAFYRCRQLTTVVFPQKVAGIGNFAFYYCTSLSSVTFAEDAQLYAPISTASMTLVIGDSAFERCIALRQITIPAITSTLRSPDYYGYYNGPDAVTNPVMLSPYYEIFAPGNTLPVFRYAFALSAFKNCSSLESVIFEPSGSDWGLFAYFASNKAYPVFEGCSNLKSVVFGAEQPYYADPNRAIAPGYTTTYCNIWTDSGVAPDLFYVVNYYATDLEQAASGDDAYASNRYARVAYQRNTPVADIARSDEQALASRTYGDSAAYAKEGYADGIAPDPQAVALAIGLDQDTEWVWKLGASQSRRVGLTDSCYAYLAPTEDISAGRIDAAQITTMYKLCDQNLSQGQEPTKDSLFDVARYYVSEANLNQGRYIFVEEAFKLYLDEGETAWFTLDSTVEESFFNQIKVYAPDGTLLDTDDYHVTFERYDAAKHQLISAILGEQDGPLLMTITPSEQSGYAGVLQEWVLVKGQTGSVREKYTTSPTATRNALVYYNGSPGGVREVSPFNGPYAVAIGSADLSSALVASGFAGLVSAPISVLDTTDSSYGFDLSAHFYPGTGAIIDGLVTFSATTRTPQEFAVAAYNAFEENLRTSLNVSASTYPWGDTAVLVAPNSLDDVAGAASAYAYAKKAPVFYIEDDGSVSNDTLTCLKGFSKVVVFGDAALFADDAFDALAADLGDDTGLARIGGDAGSASSLSLAVARMLIDEGVADCSVVTVTDAADAADAIVALSQSGHEGGLALVSAGTADSKLISTFLHEKRDTVRTVRLFGRDASHMSSASFDLYDSLCYIWNNSSQVPAVDQGDTLVLYGLQFKIGSDNELTFTARLWGTSGLVAGSYVYDGKEYSLLATVEADTDPPVDPDPDDPDPEDPDPDDPDPDDPDPEDGSKDSPDDTDSKDGTNDTSTKNPGTGTVTSPSANSNQSNASGSSTATLVVSPFTVTGTQNTGDSDDNNSDDDDGEALLLVGTDTPLAEFTVTNYSGEAEAGQQDGADPQTAAAYIGSAISALGAALLFALRRLKNPAAALLEVA
jgi:hypothetical protein